MAHPDSDGAAEMLEGGHRAVATAAMRLAELYAQRMQIHARLREQRARAASATDQRHADIAAAATQTLNTAARRTPPSFTGQGTDSEQARAEAIRNVTPDEFSQARVQAAQELAGTGTGGDAADEQAVTRRQFEILESEAFVRAVLDDREQWEARQIAATPHDRAVEEAREQLITMKTPQLVGDWTSTDLNNATAWMASTSHVDWSAYHLTQQEGNDHNAAQIARENVVNRYRSANSGQRETTVTAEPGYDSVAARSRRADTLERTGLDRDIIESAMITDLGFGTPAAESVTPAATKRRPAAQARNRGAERQHQTLGR